MSKHLIKFTQKGGIKKMYKQCYFLNEQKINEDKTGFNELKRAVKLKYSTIYDSDKLNDARKGHIHRYLDECFTEEEIDELITVDRITSEQKKEISKLVRIVNSRQEDIRKVTLTRLNYNNRHLVVLISEYKNQPGKFLNCTFIKETNGQIRLIDMYN